jgi:prepilin-type N-terminal cleavage/methylation domain-containing protein
MDYSKAYADTALRGVHTRRSSRGSGFTLVELLLVVSLLTALAGGAAFVAFGFKASTDLRLSVTIIEQAVQSARFYAFSGRAGDPWGIKVLSDEVVVFRGTTYADRTLGQDEVVPFPSTLSLSGIDEVTFSQFSGLPNITGSIGLQNSAGTEGLVLNEQGIITD